MTIPTTIRTPFVFVEFDSSRAFQGPSIMPYKVLLVGQRTSAGTKDQLTLQRLLSADQALTYFGDGSMLHRMAIKHFMNNRPVEVWAIALDDDGGATAAEGSIAITGSATADGTLAALIAGKRIAVAVTSGDSADDVGSALETAVNAETSLPVTASNSSGTVTFTAKNAGEEGDSIDLRINYYSGEETPAGLTITVNAMTGGATNPDIQDVIDVVGDEWYHVICCPYNDSANLTAIETELASRFGYDRMIDGIYVTAFKPTGADKATKLSNLSSFGNGRNSKHVTAMEANSLPASEAELCAAYGGQLAVEGQADPARPFQSLQLYGILPPAIVDRFTQTERNTLLFDGIATSRVDAAGAVRVERAITMYQTNAVGASDIAYLDVNTLLTLMYMRWDFRNQILSRYPRAKLADDGVRVGPGQQVMTPKQGKAEAVAIFRGWEFRGLAENIDQFKNDLQCVRNASDPNRLDWVLPPDLMNQFRVGAATIQFLLQSPSVE